MPNELSFLSYTHYRFFSAFTGSCIWPNISDATGLSSSVLSLYLIQSHFIDFIHIRSNLCLQLTPLQDEVTIVLFVGKL
jgi:hypothetical protein